MFIRRNECHSLWSGLYFPWLHSVTFVFAHNSIVQSERTYIIDQILLASPRLSHLTVEWEDLGCCTRSNTNVEHLHLQLNKRSNDPNLYIDIDHLRQRLPSIRYLDTSKGNIAFNEHLIRFIVKTVDTFDQLIQLIINKGNFIRLTPETEVTTKQAIFNSGNKRLMNSDVCQISFPRLNELWIWLS